MDLNPIWPDSLLKGKIWTQRYAHRENAGEDEGTDEKWSTEILLQAKKHQRLQEATESKPETWDPLSQPSDITNLDLGTMRQ